MAARLLERYAVAWPQPVRDAITPKVLVDTFVPSAHGGLTSARPALMAYALGCMGSASSGTADAVLGGAQGDVFFKLKTESVRDTLSALVSLAHIERRALRDVVAGDYTCAELMAIRDGKGLVHFKNWAYEEPAAVQHDEGDTPLDNKGVISAQPEKLAALIGCLRERSLAEKDSDVVQLRPPYAALLKSWIRRNGALAVSMHDDKIDLDFATRSNLVLIGEERVAVSKAGLWGKATTAFWASMLSNGIGFREVSKAGSSEVKIGVRVPASADEFDQVPALARLNDMLSAKFLAAVELKQQEADKEKQKRIHVPPKPSLYKVLHDAVAADVGGTIHVANFQEQLGMELILAFRHFHSHVWGDAPAVVRNGLTAAVVAEAVDAVVAVLAAGNSGRFALDPAKPEQLTTRKRLAYKLRSLKAERPPRAKIEQSIESGCYRLERNRRGFPAVVQERQNFVHAIRRHNFEVYWLTNVEKDGRAHEPSLGSRVLALCMHGILASSPARVVVQWPTMSADPETAAGGFHERRPPPHPPRQVAPPWCRRGELAAA